MKSDIQNESRQLSQLINNNRTLTRQEIKDFNNKLKQEHSLIQEYINTNNIESLDLKCQLLSILIKSQEKPKDHSFAISIGNGLHSSKENKAENIEDLKRLESNFSNCGYELIYDFGNDFKDLEDLDILWLEDNKLNEGESTIKEISKPIILFKKKTIQKGKITAIKQA